ncbi:hypothetical protein [Tuberibacillus calidus]|jgi:hypothetical protein|uniref:hypothetical protein n=1 Tax=Tuberibacillus calidus TaxID=340097 RepID=UPI000424B365|nr:hypothetical protein [Tuberibacillus calidus]
MKWSLGKLAVCVLLGLFLYRNRHYFIKLIMAVFVLNRLCESVRFDFHEVFTNRKREVETDPA